MGQHQKNIVRRTKEERAYLSKQTKKGDWSPREVNRAMILEKENNMKLLLQILIILFISSSCGGISEQDKEYDDFMRSQIELIYDRYRLATYSLGGFNEEGVKGYSLTFKSNRYMNVVEARALIVHVIEDLMVNGNAFFKLNAKKELTLKNYQIAIVFMSAQTNTFYTQDQGLAKVAYSDGVVHFVDNQGGAHPLQTVLNEPYSEAYEKVTGKTFHEPKVPGDA